MNRHELVCRSLRFLLVLGALVGCAKGVAAQGGPAPDLVVTPAEIVFPVPTQLDFRQGWVAHPGVTITVSPRNRQHPDWRILVRASTPDMGGYGKPVQDILYRVPGSTEWTRLATVEQFVAEGSGEQSISVQLRLILNWALDRPGTYTVPIEFSSGPI